MFSCAACAVPQPSQMEPPVQAKGLELENKGGVQPRPPPPPMDPNVKGVQPLQGRQRQEPQPSQVRTRRTSDHASKGTQITISIHSAFSILGTKHRGVFHPFSRDVKLEWCFLCLYGFGPTLVAFLCCLLPISLLWVPVASSPSTPSFFSG